MKNLKLLSISLLLVAIVLACNLLNNASTPNNKNDDKPASSVATLNSQIIPTQTPLVIIALTYTPAVVIASPFPPNTPVWSIYKYTCELVDGGGTMTMNLTWDDRSNNEDGYKVYRNKQVIATLAPNSTHFVDVSFVATGKTLSYFVEAFTQTWRASSSTVIYGCQ